MYSLNDKLSILPKVGKTSVKYLKKLGLESIHDLLFYLPFRYDDFRERKKISDLKADQACNIQGEILLIQNRRSYKSKLNITEALISDDSGTIKAIWFNQPFLSKSLKVGDSISLAGKTSYNQGQLTLVSPQYEKAYNNQLIHTSGLIPIYHLSSGLTQKQLRYFIKKSLPLVEKLEEWLPEESRRKLKLLELSQAVKKIHTPKSLPEANEARKRLLFSELFFRQLKSQMTKQELKLQKAFPVKFIEKETKKFVSSLPFTLTDAQKQAAWEILKDIEKDKPMSRLLEGDVGSGKTVVAAMAMQQCISNDYKAVMMAPTQILASQHYNTLNELFKNNKNKIKIALLTGAKKEKIDENTDIIVGTQAILHKQKSLEKVALTIVDEQHRFGVNQRQKILDFKKGDDIIPHFLSMTATPIPRSLALAIYGDLDLSIIKNLPSDRKKIITKVITDNNRTKAYDFIKQEVKKGRQAFIICPLIEESDVMEIKSAKAEYERLSKDVFPDLKIGLLHGKMKKLEKEKTMTDMLEKKIDILVSTSVIEVGVDIQNASVIAIEGSERFGLAQLHQFRGRVGRSKYQSYCFLLPTNENSSENTKTRLQAMEKHNDGFTLSKIDLKLRGAGDIYGRSQSGFNEIQLANIFDYEVIKASNEEAAKIIEKDPHLAKHPKIKEQLGNWQEKIHLE